jgi:ABC-type amino acid transport system permease subunit
VGIRWNPDPAKKVKHAPKSENRVATIDQFAAAALRLLLFTGARFREIQRAGLSGCCPYLRTGVLI